MFALIENNKVIKTFTTPFNYEKGGVTFTIHSKSANVLPVRQVTYDKKKYICSGYTAKITNSEVVKEPILTPIPEEELLDMKKASLIEELKAYAEGLFDRGFIFNGNPYDINSEAQRNIMVEYNVAVDTENNPTWSEGYRWRLFDNSFVNLTRADVISLGKAARAHKLNILETKWLHETAINGASSLSEITDYDITVNFPNTAN